jgi:EAL domain-containing protein (putative c-di-GMP-specific phosphodiesterase class I)
MSRPTALPHRHLVLWPAGVMPAISALGRRIRAVSRPGLAILFGILATAILAVPVATDAMGLRQPADTLIVLVSSGAASLALYLKSLDGEATVLGYRPLAIAVGLTCLGHAALAVVPLVAASTASFIANTLWAVGATWALAVIIPTLVRRLDRPTMIAAGLDAGIMLLAGTTILYTLWRAGEPSAPAVLLPPLYAAALWASAFMAAVAALAMRAVPDNRGFWVGLPGVALVGLSWIIWVDGTIDGLARTAQVSLLYSSGILVLSYGWLTWHEEIGFDRGHGRLARWLADWVPMGAILLCVVVEVIPHRQMAGIDLAPVGTAAVVLMSIIRQRQLIVSERQASAKLASEVEERAQSMVSLARLERAATLAETAGRICSEALRLKGVEAAAVYAFGHSGSVVPLAIEGVTWRDEAVGERLSRGRALHLVGSAGRGTWIDAPADLVRIPGEAVVSEAFAPMHWDDRIVGVVSMGTTRSVDARRLAQRLPTLTEFGVVSAALLGPLLTEHWRLADIRSHLEDVIANHAFEAVFQPIVCLQTRGVVGYEALTRFNDGTQPDTRFLEARSAGMSVRLETACLARQLENASWLPDGTWLSLNVSPDLVTAVVPLVAALERADREVVLEITEHVEIADYRELLRALELVRGSARLAVDDAGAGYAGLRHILELRPQFVKLDVSLVRNVDTDPARQAMVAGMAHFARDSGCELIAEGIETEDESAALVRLGVSLGQGYLFGVPAPIV